MIGGLETLGPLVLPVALVVAGVVGLWVIKEPKAGFLLYAAAAPIADHIGVGPYNITHFLGFALFAAVGLRAFQKGDFRIDRMVAPHAVALFVLVVYAWILGGFAGTTWFLATAGSVGLLVAVFYLYHAVEDIERWFWVFALAFAASNLLVLVLAVISPATVKRLFFSGESAEGVRLAGTFDNPNQFATPQILACCLVLFFVLRRTGWRRQVALVAAFAQFAALLLAQSRSAIGGLILGIAATGFLLVQGDRRLLKPALVAAGMLGLFIVGYLALPKEIGDIKLARVESDTVGTRKVGLYDISFEDLVRERFAYYTGGIETIFYAPFGLGYRAQADVIYDVSGTYKQPHNFMLKNYLTYGIVGGTYLNGLLLTVPLYLGWLLWKGRIAPTSYAVFAAGGMIGYLGHSMFHSATNWNYVWVVWGLALRLAQLELRRRRVAW